MKLTKNEINKIKKITKTNKLKIKLQNFKEEKKKRNTNL